MKPTASFLIRKNVNSMTNWDRTGKQERISGLHRIGVAMCGLNSEMSVAALATSVTSLRVCSEVQAEGPARGERASQLAAATWKLRSASLSKRPIAAQLGPLLFVVPMENKNPYSSTYQRAYRTENSSTFRTRVPPAPAAPLRDTSS